LDPDDMNLADSFEFEDDDRSPTPPDFRVTIRGRRLMVAPWAPYLLNEGPHGDLVRARAQHGVTIADAWVTGEDCKELIVRYLAIADRDRADRQLVRWAESVGHRRIWFPDRLVHLDAGRPLGAAQVECPTCGARWQDGSPGFWEGVRSAGRFPTLCVICHGDLPQWRWRPETCTVKGMR
jgi:hypothetical protein